MQMNELIASFPQQLEEALQIAERVKIRPATQPLQNVVVMGLGGSGIGANFAASFVQDELKLPYLVLKGYDTPAYVGANSLVICSSYSGNTEETLQGLETAFARGAKIVCIASGGKLLEFAAKNDLDFIKLPNYGAPPRACLGYSLVQQLAVLQQLGLISEKPIADIRASIALLQTEQSKMQLKADKIARTFVGKFPILYATDRMEAVLVRLRQQLNENAKILCSHHVVPEMNHNELVGWREQPIPFIVLIFRSSFDNARNQLRIDINKDIISNFTNTIVEIHCKGDTLIEQMLYAVHLGDWISWEVAQLRQVDAVEVKVIDMLKSQLANFSPAGDNKQD